MLDNESSPIEKNWDIGKQALPYRALAVQNFISNKKQNKTKQGQTQKWSCKTSESF